MKTGAALIFIKEFNIFIINSNVNTLLFYYKFECAFWIIYNKIKRIVIV